MLRRVFCLLPLFAVALALARDKPQNWIEVRSPHFVLVSNAGEKQVRHVAGQFERMRLAFHATFPSLRVDPGSPIVVLAVRDRNDFRTLEPQDYLGKGNLQVAGLFLPALDKNYVLMRLDAQEEHPYAVIYHEYTHLLLSKVENLPLWLNEGLAEFFQNTEIRENEVRLGEADPANVQLLRQNHLLPLATLFNVGRSSPYYHEENKGSIFYAESWALTHYLFIKDLQKKSDGLAGYVALLSQEVDSVTAASRAFGDLTQLQKSLERYIGEGSFRYLKVPSSTQVDESAFQTRAIPETQANAVRAEFLAYDKRTADARALLDAILHEDPNNISAHETMGFLAFRDGHLDEASKWYRETMKLDSQNFLAYYYLAAIAMQGGSLDSARAEQVESSLRGAIRLNPNFAPSYDRLAVFYAMRQRNLNEAHMLSLKAIQLDPTNLAYRLDLANILLAMGRGKDAVPLIQRAMSLAKSPAEVNRAQFALEQAQRYEDYQETRETTQANNQPTNQDTPLPTLVTRSSEREADSSDSDSPVVLRREETAPTGPHRIVTGVIKDVHCSSPSRMDFEVASTGGTIDLHSGNYHKVAFTALDFIPWGELQPCTQLEGVHAKVEYIEPSAQTSKAWVVAVEMRK